MWRKFVKDVLLLIYMLSLSLTAVAITLVAHGSMLAGALLLSIALLLGIPSLSIAYYWHKRDIHVTPPGMLMALLFFISSVLWLWIYGFYFWIPAALLAINIAWSRITYHGKR